MDRKDIPHIYRLLLIAVVLLAAIPVQAASPVESLKFLDGYFNDNPRASVTMVKGKPLKQYSLDEYRGLTLQYSPEDASRIEESVKNDSRMAIDKETSYRKGELYYAFLTLPKSGKGKSRYLFYLNQTLAKGDKIILIYMEGNATADKIKKLIKK